MPIIKSAKKRVRVSTKAATRNSKTKRNLRDSLKNFYATLTGGKADKISVAHASAVSAIDTAAKKNVIHKNKAARKKQQLATAMKQANVKLPTAKKTAPKTSRKAAQSGEARTKRAKTEAPVKKVVAKKPAVKKAVTKKTK